MHRSLTYQHIIIFLKWLWHRGAVLLFIKYSPFLHNIEKKKLQVYNNNRITIHIVFFVATGNVTKINSRKTDTSLYIPATYHTFFCWLKRKTYNCLHFYRRYFILYLTGIDFHFSNSLLFNEHWFVAFVYLNFKYNLWITEFICTHKT